MFNNFLRVLILTVALSSVFGSSAVAQEDGNFAIEMFPPWSKMKYTVRNTSGEVLATGEGTSSITIPTGSDIEASFVGPDGSVCTQKATANGDGFKPGSFVAVEIFDVKIANSSGSVILPGSPAAPLDATFDHGDKALVFVSKAKLFIVRVADHPQDDSKRFYEVAYEGAGGGVSTSYLIFKKGVWPFSEYTASVYCGIHRN